MGSKGNKRHLKRLAAPGFIKIQRKNRSSGFFFLKPRPGAHPKNFCLSIGHVLRDMLKLTKNTRESKYLLNEGKILIDGKVIRKVRYPIGLMDVVRIPEIKKSYRILPSKTHGLILSEIVKEESSFKLCRIENISNVKNGNLQLHLHDGRNVKIPSSDSQKYKTFGTVKILIPEQKILEYFPLEEGNQSIISSGNNIGEIGVISKLSKRFGVNASTAEIQTENDEKINTAYGYVFVIGKENSSIDLPMNME